jgi:hypothetical protein
MRPDRKRTAWLATIEFAAARQFPLQMMSQTVAPVEANVQVKAVVLSAVTVRSAVVSPVIEQTGAAVRGNGQVIVHDVAAVAPAVTFKAS